MKTLFMKAALLSVMTIGLDAAAQAEEKLGQTPVAKGLTMTNPTYVQEYNAITEVLNNYIEGCKRADSSIMKSSFNQKATMYSVGVDGKLEGGVIPILFDGVDKDFKPSPDAQAAIVRIEIVGTAASARIDANDVSGISFTDFFHLLKVDGKWTVISKIFHTHVAS